MMSETFESQLKKVKFLEERYENERYQWGIYSFMFDGREEEIQVIVDYKEKKIHKNLKSITELLNQQENFMKKVNVQQAEIERLEENEVKECQFCGEFRTEYHEYEDYSWSAEDYCNAGHYLEDTDPNTCKDYWDK